jgi:hypothetical protein
MVRTIRTVLLSVGMLFLAARSSLAQAPDMLPALQPESSTLPTFAQPQWTPPIRSGSLSMGNARASDQSLEDRNGSILIGNALLDGPRNNLGWFATVDLNLVGSHVQNQLTAMVTTGPMVNQVSLPSARLDWTVGPRFEAGYRFGQAGGEFLVAYRFLSTSGTETTPAFDAAGNDGSLHSRLVMNIIDLDYAAQEPSLQPWFEMKWRFGVRMANVYFDSQETSPLLQQHVTNFFFGAGPHAALELWSPGKFLFCKLDAAAVMGKVRQGFEETIPGTGSGFTRQEQFMAITNLNVQVGIAWTPWENCRVSFGYTYEHWWDVGFTGIAASRGQLMTQGVFFRGEWQY